MPVVALFTPKAPEALPPVTFPVIVSVPVEPWLTAAALDTVPPVQLPTIVADAGELAVNCKQLREVVVDLLVTLAVSVMPSFNVNIPVPALLTSSQVTLAVMVTV
jgi:hypothetical protein